MKNLQFRLILSAVILCSVFMATTLSTSAAPVKFEQVRQIINARPGKAATSAFEQLRLVGDDDTTVKNGDGTTSAQPSATPPSAPTQDDGRVIVEITSEIVEDEVCDCPPLVAPPGGFPYGFLALGAVPLLFLIPRGRDRNRTPPPPETPTTETPTPTTQTPTPTTPTPTPPEPVPEPMTILLFGTGLAGIGMAARKRFGKADKTDDAPEIQ